MEKTANNRKKIWICIGLALALYIGRNYLMMQSMQQERAARIIHALQGQLQQAKAASSNSAAPGAPVPAPTPPDLMALAGKWQGGIMVPKRGMCTLTLEVDPIRDKAGQFSAYSTLGCIFNTTLDLLTHKHDPQAMVERMGKGNSPTSAILSGLVKDNTLAFTADKNVGVAEVPGACDMKAITVRPFGVNQVAVDFQNPPCEEGQLVMRRMW